MRLRQLNLVAPVFRPGNPPYQGLSKTESFGYVQTTYPNGKADLYAAFLERGLQLKLTVDLGKLIDGARTQVAVAANGALATTSTVPTATFTSRALAGTAAGDCTANDFWTVARVTFTSPSTCTVTPIDTYRASSAACTSF